MRYQEGSMVYELVAGEWHQTAPIQLPENANFVICCSYGDWSGFRTLANCLRQIPENRSGMVDFWIEER